MKCYMYTQVHRHTHIHTYPPSLPHTHINTPTNLLKKCILLKEANIKMTACFNPISMTLESAKPWRELEKATQPTKQQRSVVVKDFKGVMDKRIENG